MTWFEKNTRSVGCGVNLSMKNNHEKLITALVDDLKPVDKPAGFVMPFQLWLIMAVLFAGGLAWLREPYRVGALDQLVGSVQF